MAFLAVSGDHHYWFQGPYIGSNPGLKEWHYITPDAITTVTGGGYVDDASVIAGVSIGDYIRVFQCSSRNDLSTSTRVYRIKVTGKTATSLTLAADTIGTGELGSDLLASQTEARIGSDLTKVMTPYRVAQAIDVRLSTRSIMEFRLADETIDDGVTDAAPALLAAFQWALTNKGLITLPPGRFALNSQAVLSGYVSPNNVDNLLNFGMIGAGRQASVFVLPAANTAGAWKILFTAGKVYWTSLWREFGIEVQSTKTDSIIRIGMDGVAPGGGGAQRNVVMERVDVYGISSAPVHLSAISVVDLSWTNRTIVDDCVMYGGPGGGVTEGYLTPCILDISSSYDFRVSRCDLYHAKSAINSVGGDQETCRIYDNTLVDFSTGIRILRASKSNKTKTITAISKGATTTITSVAHGLSDGERLFIRFIVGTIELNERWFKVLSHTADTAVIGDIWSGLDINSSTYGAYVSGGTAYQIDASSLQPLFNIYQNHIHCNDVGLDLCGLDVGSNIHNNDIHMSGSAPTYSPGYGIWIQKSQKTMLFENDIYWPGGVVAPFTSGARDIMVDSNAAIGLANIIRLSNNTHYSGLTAVEVTAGSTAIRINAPFITSPSYTTPFIFPSTTQTQLFWSPQASADTWEFQTTDPNAAAEPLFYLYRNSASPAAADLGGSLLFSANNDALAQKTFAQIVGRSDTVTAGAEAGGLNFYAITAGAQSIAFSYSATAFTAVLPIYAQVGAEATPAYTFAADTDCGYWRQAANTISFSLNAVEQWRAGVTALAYRSDRIIGWSASVVGALDTGLSRSSAGVVKFENGSGTLMDWTARNGTLSATLTFSAGGQIDSDSGTTTASGTGATSTATLSKMAGIITTDAITTAAGGSHVMTITNTLVASGDIVILTRSGGSNTRRNFDIEATTGTNTITLSIYNNEPANAINGNIKFTFLVMKA